MRHERLPLQAAQQRAQLLLATQGLGIVALTAAPLFAVLSPRDWAASSFVAVAALALLAQAYLVNGSRVAFQWSLAALACLAPAQTLIWLHDPAVLSGTLSVAALAAMVLSVLTSRPRVRACIIAAIDKDIEARMARARALSFAAVDG